MARHHEVLTVVVVPSDDDMGMGMPGVEMIGGDPVKPGPQVPLHSPHEITHEGLEVGHAATVLRRHDQAELIGVTLLSLQEASAVSRIVLAVIELAGAILTRNAIAHDV